MPATTAEIYNPVRPSQSALMELLLIDINFQRSHNIYSQIWFITDLSLQLEKKRKRKITYCKNIKNSQMWYVNTCFQLRTHKNTSSQPGSVISNVNHNLKNLHKQNKKHIPERVFMFLISIIQNMSIDLNLFRPPPGKCCCAFHVSEGGQKQERLLVSTYLSVISALCDTKKKKRLYLKLSVLVYT